MVFIDINTDIPTEGRNFKTLSKKVIQLFRTVATYQLKKTLNMELDLLLVLVSLHRLDIPELYNIFSKYFAVESDDEFDSLSVCNFIYLGTFNK